MTRGVRRLKLGDKVRISDRDRLASVSPSFVARNRNLDLHRFYKIVEIDTSCTGRRKVVRAVDTCAHEFCPGRMRLEGQDECTCYGWSNSKTRWFGLTTVSMSLDSILGTNEEN